ncbi:hypothetical protein AB4238_18995 [Shewanella sp. 10N.286.45.A1]|uniref:hypothetical protein n=1 Tax=Shewanella sp. 10N.286.45.A1 TaxID=3229694 RepID=UPI003551DC83
MNYTDWLRSEFPQLRASTSTETLEYINQAKSETKWLALTIAFFSGISSVVISSYALESYGFMPFRSVVSWAVLAVALFVGAKISNRLEVAIMKARIRKLIAATKAR